MLERAYGASCIGKVHVKLKKPNQDAFLISNSKNYTFAIVCDGLGSKKYSHVGSKKLCKLFKKRILKCYKKKNLEFNEFIIKLKKQWKRSIWPIKPKQADATCLFTFITNNSILCGQLGDGIIAINKNDEINIVSKKDDDFANETNSFYKSNIDQWNYKIIKKEKDCKYNMLLTTDGISDDLIIDTLPEFISELSNNLNDKKYKNNKFLYDLLLNWPNKYSTDDKTVVVIKNE